ncbi:MAG: ABC transporter ATP-binding protein [Ilumatobacter sp.]|uniref:ABC transporter ATP-binding protein n=1 Tax=Ilumatobacter sp. TaxID=1967498 RepID=UPI0032981FE4
MPDRLSVSSLSCSYGRKNVVFEVDLHVRPGEVVALFGHNGAGKTTVIKNILGAYTPSSGTVTYDGEDITGASPRSNVQRGMALIPSERFVFGDLTVHDNLLLGAAGSTDGEYLDRKLAEVHDLFPILKERAKQLAGTMSGGQQRMVSLGLAMMSSPRLLLLDEPSLGLAPAIVEQIFGAVHDLAADGLSVLLLEQNVGQALKIADRSYVMRSGRVILEETTEQMLARESYWDLF